MGGITENFGRILTGTTQSCLDNASLIAYRVNAPILLETNSAISDALVDECNASCTVDSKIFLKTKLTPCLPIPTNHTKKGVWIKMLGTEFTSRLPKRLTMPLS